MQLRVIIERFCQVWAPIEPVLFPSFYCMGVDASGHNAPEAHCLRKEVGASALTVSGNTPGGNVLLSRDYVSLSCSAILSVCAFARGGQGWVCGLGFRPDSIGAILDAQARPPAAMPLGHLPRRR